LPEAESAERQIGVYSARLTNARFLGDVTVSEAQGLIRLSGERASSRLMMGRLVIQWSLAALAIVGILAGIPYSFQLLVGTLIFSFVAYLVLWWTSRTETVTVNPASVREADIGWVWRPQDLLFLGSAFAAAGLASAAARTVSFRLPAHEGGVMLVVLHSREARDVVRLLNALGSTA